MDVAAWTEKHLTKWRWPNLAAAVLIALVLFEQFNLNWPYMRHVALSDSGGKVPGVVSRMLERFDARGFIPARTAAKDDGFFDLMIIADSSILIIDAPPEFAYKGQRRYTLTPIIAQHIASIGGKKLRIHEYYQDGTRTFDIRRALLSGIADPQIDAVAVSVNPFLYFNDLMAFAFTTQRSKLLYMKGLAWSDYLTLCITLRPSDVMMDALSAVSPLFAKRTPLNKALNQAVSARAPSGLPFPALAAPPARPQYMITNWIDWFYPAEVSAAVRDSANPFYAAALLSANLDGGSIGEAVLRNNLQALGEWGKPAIFYVPPVNPSFLSDPNWPAMQNTIRHFTDVSARYPSANIHIVTGMVENAYPPVLYHDEYHMRRGDGFVRQFADMLEDQLGMPIVRNDPSGLFGTTK
jgi:hypothetical protein